MYIYIYIYIYIILSRINRTTMNLLLKVSRLSETLSSKFIVVLFILLRIILSSILHIEHC